MPVLTAVEPEMVSFSPSDSAVESEEDGKGTSFSAHEMGEREERETALQHGRLQELEVDVGRVLQKEGRVSSCDCRRSIALLKFS
jgi:hypothetical protein